MRGKVYALAGLAALGFATFWGVTSPRLTPTTDLVGLVADPVAGETVFIAAGCASCHMATGATGAEALILAGGQEFPSPFGSFVAPNISSDPEHGIGGWSVEAFSHAIRDGVSPKGGHYFPALPYNAYAKMLPQDVVNLKAYMDGLPPSTTPSQPHKVGFPFNIRRLQGGWKVLFAGGDWVMAGDLPPEIARGRYVVEALAHCGECHTPRNTLGGLDRSRWLGGVVDSAGKVVAPNITPAALTWSAGEITTYLTTGFTPEYDSVGGHMAHVVDNMARLPAEDVAAVVAYVQAVPAVP